MAEASAWFDDHILWAFGASRCRHIGASRVSAEAPIARQRAERLAKFGNALAAVFRIERYEDV